MESAEASEFKSTTPNMRRERNRKPASSSSSASFRGNERPLLAEKRATTAQSTSVVFWGPVHTIRNSAWKNDGAFQHILCEEKLKRVGLLRLEAEKDWENQIRGLPNNG